MKLAMFAGPRGPRPGAIVDGEILDFAAGVVLNFTTASWEPASVRALLERGPAGLAVARGLIDAVAAGPESARQRLREVGALRPLDGVTLLPPLGEPRMILCGGLNYPSYAHELDMPSPEHPRGFLRAPSCVTASGQPVRLPAEAPDMVDYEGELAVVIGRPTYRVTPDEALNYVGGYLCANDVSARNWMDARLALRRHQLATGLGGGEDPLALDHLYKQFPTFLPLGPWLVTADELPNPDELHLRTYVNGELRQDAHLADAFFSVGEIVAYWSRYYALQPGDVLTLGSPGGVGFARKPHRFLCHGDEVVVHIEGIGCLTNRVLQPGA